MERWLAAVPGTGSLTNRSAVRTWSITETEGRTGLLQLRRDAYVLRADAAGTVAAINYDPGEIVPAGDSVVVVLVEQTSRVLGYLPEVNAGDVTAGMTVYLSSATRAGEIVPGEVVAMVPEIMAMPSQGSPFLNRSVRGRTVIIEPEEPGAFVPGESVKIQLTRPILSVMKDWILGRSKRDGST
jgi:multidrug efflux pump subunit AcrA (membrane-fusion protein)